MTRYLCILTLTLTACVAPPEAINQAIREHGINSGHANDSTLPDEAREIGADNAAAWSAQHYALTGEHLQPPEESH